MNLPRVVMWSLWRNDAGAHLEWRALHLLSRTYPALRWAWIVGDSDDSTLADLRAIAAAVAPYRRVDVYRMDTGIKGSTPQDARRRYAATVNQWFRELPADADYVIQHESDLISPPDLVERFLGHAGEGRTHIAGFDMPITAARWTALREGLLPNAWNPR